jgi:hypothetical protein
VFGGIAGSTTFSFSGGSPTSVVIEPGDTLPAWVTSVTTTGINWGAAATAGATYSFRLRASNGFGASTSNIISGTVQAVSTGLWGTPLSYTAAIWNYTSRTGAALRTNVAAAGGNISLVGPVYASKHTQGFYRPTDGRVYIGWGDQSPANLADADGMFDTSSPGDSQPLTVSFIPGSTTMRREYGSRFSDSAPYDSDVWLSADEGFAVYDSVADRAILNNIDSFTLQFFQGGNTWRGDALTYVGPTQFSVPGDLTATYAARKAVMVECTVAAAGGATLRKRGRISGSTFGGGVTTVTVAWWDSDFAFQSPIRAVPAASNGGIQAYNDPSFRTSDSKWVTRLWAMNFTTRAWTPIVFSVPGQSDSGVNAKNAVFVPGSITGRGDEVHSWAADRMTVWNLATNTVTRPTTGGVPFGENGQCWPCFDGKRYAYIWVTGPGVFSQLRRWDVIAQTQTIIPVTYQGQPLTDTGTGTVAYLGSKAWADGIWTFWNAELNRIELWLNSAGPVGAEVYADIWLVDPANPTAPELIARQDDTGAKIRTNNPIHIPTVGSTPAQTVASADMSFGGAPWPDKMRFFIAANRRKWANVTHGQRWINNFGRGSNPNTYSSSTPSQTDKIPYFTFGAWVEGLDNSGNPTGVLYHRVGGDGDYAGNEVVQIRLDQIGSGSAVPLQANLSTDLTTANEWKNRIWCTRWPVGGTGGQSDICLNPANLSQWSPASIHTWGVNSFVPGWGYVEDFVAPLNLPSGYDNLYGSIPWIEHLTTGINPLTTQALRFWSETGANAGLWVKGPLKGSISRSTLADYNASVGKLIGFTRNTNNYSEVWEWTPGGSIVSRGNAYVRHNGENKAVMPVTVDSAAFWLSGTKYLILSKGTGDGFWPGPWIVGYDHATPAGEHTLYKGANGSAILDGMSQVTVTIDRARQEIIWWCLPSAAARFTNAFYLYRSPISDPMNLKKMYFVGEGGVESQFLDEVGGSGLRIGAAYDGYLYTMKRSGTMPVDDGDPAGQIVRIPIY